MPPPQQLVKRANFAETKEVKAVQKFLRALNAITADQFKSKDQIIHKTIESIFLVLFSCKSREFVLHIIEQHLTYQFLTSNNVKRALLSDFPFVIYSFFRLLMYDPSNADTLGSILPFMNANVNDLAVSSVAGTDIPFQQILKDVSARWVQGTLDVDIIASSVYEQISNDTKTFTGEDPNESALNIFEKPHLGQTTHALGPNGRRPSQSHSISNASQVYNANSGVSQYQPFLQRTPSQLGSVGLTRAQHINSVQFNTNPLSRETRQSISISITGDDLINSTTDTTTAEATPTSPLSPPIPAKPIRPSRPVPQPRRTSVTAIAKIANDADDNDTQSINYSSTKLDPSQSTHTSGSSPQTTIIKQIPAVSLQPFSISSDRFWLNERAILSQIVANISALFHASLVNTLETCRDTTDLEQCQREATLWTHGTFEMLSIAVEELLGWEETSVAFVRLLLYAYVSLLSSKVNELYKTEASTVPLSCCIAELGQFIEQFVFFRPTGSQTYLQRIRTRLHPSTYQIQSGTGPAFLQNQLLLKQMQEQQSFVRETYQLLNEHSFQQSMTLYRTRLQELYSNLASAPTAQSGTETSQLPTVIPDFADSIFAQLHRELSQAHSTQPTGSLAPLPPAPIFGLHFDANGCADIFLVERYFYLLGSLGFSAADKITRPIPKEYLPTNYPHNRNLYGVNTVAGTNSSGMDSLRTTSSIISSVPLSNIPPAGINPATLTQFNPLPPRYERNSGLPTPNPAAPSPAAPSVTLASHHQRTGSTSIAGLDFAPKSSESTGTSLTFRPATNVLQQYHYQCNQDIDAGETTISGGNNGSLTRTSSLLSSATNNPAQIQKQNFQHLTKTLRTATLKSFVSLLQRQHSYYKALSELLVNVFTMPILPSTTLQFPYHNMYNDALFKRIVPPNTDLLLSNSLLDQFNGLQHFPNDLVSDRLQHWYGPRGEYISQNMNIKPPGSPSHAFSQQLTPNSISRSGNHSNVFSLQPNSATHQAHHGYNSQSHYGGQQTITNHNISYHNQSLPGASPLSLSSSLPRTGPLNPLPPPPPPPPPVPPVTSAAPPSDLSHPLFARAPSVGYERLSGGYPPQPPRVISGPSPVSIPTHIATNSMVPPPPPPLDHKLSNPTSWMTATPIQQAVSYPISGTAVAGATAIPLPTCQYQYNYIQSPKEDTLFQHQLMLSPTSLSKNAVQAGAPDPTLPNGALFCNGAPINAGFNNVLTLSQALTASHNPQNLPFLLPEYRSYIGRLIGEASERHAFKTIATQLPQLMVEQIKLMMVKRRQTFAQRSAMVASEIHLISDLKWRFALPATHMRDLQQAIAQQAAATPSSSNSTQSRDREYTQGNSFLHFPAWAPLIVPSHQIPVVVNSSSHAYTHGIWAPTSIPNAIPVLPNHQNTHHDIEDYLVKATENQLSCEINFATQKVMMPLTTTLTQGHLDSYISPRLVQGLSTVKDHIDGYIHETTGQLLVETQQLSSQLQMQQGTLQQQRSDLERQADQITLFRQELTAKEAQLQAQAYQVDQKIARLQDLQRNHDDNQLLLQQQEQNLVSKQAALDIQLAAAQERELVAVKKALIDQEVAAAKKLAADQEIAATLAAAQKAAQEIIATPSASAPLPASTPTPTPAPAPIVSPATSAPVVSLSVAAAAPPPPPPGSPRVAADFQTVKASINPPSIAQKVTIINNASPEPSIQPTTSANIVTPVGVGEVFRIDISPPTSTAPSPPVPPLPPATPLSSSSPQQALDRFNFPQTSIPAPLLTEQLSIPEDIQLTSSQLQERNMTTTTTQQFGFLSHDFPSNMSFDGDALSTFTAATTVATIGSPRIESRPLNAMPIDFDQPRKFGVQDDYDNNVSRTPQALRSNLPSNNFFKSSSTLGDLLITEKPLDKDLTSPNMELEHQPIDAFDIGTHFHAPASPRRQPPPLLPLSSAGTAPSLFNCSETTDSADASPSQSSNTPTHIITRPNRPLRLNGSPLSPLSVQTSLVTSPLPPPMSPINGTNVKPPPIPQTALQPANLTTLPSAPVTPSAQQ